MPTKEEFDAYERVRSNGNWNMIMQAREAAKEAGLDLTTYYNVIRNYEVLLRKYYPNAGR